MNAWPQKLAMSIYKLRAVSNEILYLFYSLFFNCLVAPLVPAGEADLLSKERPFEDPLQPRAQSHILCRVQLQNMLASLQTTITFRLLHRFEELDVGGELGFVGRFRFGQPDIGEGLRFVGRFRFGQPDRFRFGQSDITRRQGSIQRRSRLMSTIL